MGRATWWRTALLVGLAVHAPAPPPASTFVIETDRLGPYTRTYVGNGVFSLTSTPRGTDPAESYMVWVYDHAPGDVPRIAVLPAWNEIDLFNGTRWLNDVAPDAQTLRDYRQRLDMYDGLLTTRYEWADGRRTVTVEVQAFVSRADPHLAVVRFRVTPHEAGPLRVAFPIRAWPPPRRLDLERAERLDPAVFQGPWPAVWYPGSMTVRERGATATHRGGRLWTVAATEGRGTLVALTAEVEWPSDLPEMAVYAQTAADVASVEVEFHAEARTTYAFTKYVGAVASRDAPAPRTVAAEVAQTARRRGYDAVRAEHVEAWHRLWATDIVIEGDPELQRVVRAMVFYVLGSVREGTDFSVPPMGLSSAGYYGHVFWDADTWVLPALVVMHPEMARSMVMFRYRTLEAAQAKARRHGYEGAMYPWEADELGAETTPKFAEQNALYEIHVTGDVALAQWQYFLATGDRAWLRRYGYPVLRETARFWVDRSTWNPEKGRYEVRNVVSVDEGLVGVDNDAYTNAVARRNLEVAVAASRLLGEAADPRWAAVAERLLIPYDPQGRYHPTYENAPPETRGSVVPLLAYPLEIPMSRQAKRNDLQAAARRLSQNPGGMMGITLLPVVAAELEDARLFQALLPMSYRPYLRPPFDAPAETPHNEAVHFLTGAGGLLQQVIYGWTGLRLSERGWTPRFRPMLPPSVRRLVLKNFRIRSETYTITVEGRRLSIEKVGGQGPRPAHDDGLSCPDLL